MDRKDVGTSARKPAIPAAPCPGALGILGTPAARWKTRADLSQQLDRARKFLSNCAFDSGLVALAAKEAGLSLHHFTRLFHERYGTTPHGYVAGRRLEAAKALLDSSAMSVTEIALEVGFEGGSALGRWFKQQTGLTPTQYRARPSTR